MLRINDRMRRIQKRNNNYISSHDKLNSKQLIVIEHLNDDEKKMRKEWLEFMATTKSKKVKDEDRVIVKDLLSEI